MDEQLLMKLYRVAVYNLRKCMKEVNPVQYITREIISKGGN